MNRHMASSPTPTSVPSSSLVCPKKYDVFVSFRGEDTRTSFTCHLNGALVRKNIKTYIDDKLDRGDVIFEALMKAIEDSYATIVIFSENYASSKWCLDELTRIMECREDGGQIVIPVFYGIDPSNVRKQSGSYENAFAKHEGDFKHNKDKLKKWRAALTEAADLSGYHSLNFRNDFELIEQIVKDLMQKLEHVYPVSELRGLVGVERNYAHIESLLNINSGKVRIIGIWGIGGIGKTTLSEVLFAKLSSQYEGRCFLRNVRMESKNYGLKHLLDKLLSELLGEEAPQVISSFFWSRLSRKRVFIVLDDVNSPEQLEYLVGKHHCLGRGSRVIVTSRDKHVFSKGVDKIHEMKKLDDNHSLQLFCLNAFSKSNPEKQFEELSTKAVIYARGLPLALKVLGSFLNLKSKKEWNSALTKLQKSPNEEIQNVLRLSYDELDYEEKNIFLDVACFLKGWNKNDVTRLLEAYKLYPDIGIRRLVEKALITISDHNIVEMHDLIQEMGKDIVRQESVKDLGKRSRLWDPKDVYHVLKYNKGTDVIEGILLDASQFGDLNLSADVFKNMINLRFLKINAAHESDRSNLYLPFGLEFLPDKLIYLHWNEFPLKSLPLTFCAENLVKLYMPNCHVEKLWNGVQNLAFLREIMLSGSQQLQELPDMSRASNLKSVYLQGCRSLCDVHPSILSLPKLRRLYLDDCKALKSLRSNVLSKSLEDLSVMGCSSLQELLVASKNKRSSYLWSMGIDELPPSVIYVGKLEYFQSFRVTQSRCKLENIFERFWSIVELDLSECTLSELPENIHRLVNLVTLNLNESHLVRLPTNIRRLSLLEHLFLRKCWKLEYLPELPPLAHLDARGCTSLKRMLFKFIKPRVSTGNSGTFYSFENCIRLCQDEVGTLMARARVTMEREARKLLIEKEKSFDDDEESLNNDMIKFCLPGNEFPDWFRYFSTPPLIIFKIPPACIPVGFAFCAILSASLSDRYNLSCECSFEADDGKTVYFKSWFMDDNCQYKMNREDKFICNYVYLWFDIRCSLRIMNKLRFSSGNEKELSFTFSVLPRKRKGLLPCEASNGGQVNNKEMMIRLCGVETLRSLKCASLDDLLYACYVRDALHPLGKQLLVNRDLRHGSKN